MGEALVSVLFASIAVVAGLVAIACFWQWFYATPTDQDETIYIRTADGWRLALHHYGSADRSRGLPIILCHGLSSNRYVFDMPAAPSLARFLSARGRDVWVAELRGSGLSQGPGLRASDVPYSWEFEDHLRGDVPAIIQHVLGCTGARAVHWLGHSMGGLLILAHLARRPDSPVASAVALGSPVDFSKIRNRNFKWLLKASPLVKHLPVFPLPFVGKLLTPLAHALPNGLLGLFYLPNLDPAVARRVLAIASQLVTSTKLWLDFGRFLGTGVFASAGGRPYLKGLEMAKVPVLLASGAKDLMAPPEAVEAARDALAHDGNCTSIVFGKGSGNADGYGHMDLLVGARSEAEVFPALLDWVENFDEEQFQEAAPRHASLAP